MIDGMRWAKTREHPDLAMKPGDYWPVSESRGWRILWVSEPEFSEYLKEWAVSYRSYLELDPCPCCGQPRGAGSLHP